MDGGGGGVLGHDVGQLSEGGDGVLVHDAGHADDGEGVKVKSVSGPRNGHYGREILYPLQ